MSRTRRVSALVYLLLIALACSSCSHWRRQWIDPVHVVERDHPTVLRVTRPDGVRMEIRNPAIAGDSLISAPVQLNRGKGTTLGPTSVALKEIDYVEARRSRSTPGILILGLLVPFALGAVVALTWD